jgi:acetoacetyl-CoA reductase/3-oxoacyl-[acyl-carrier protein] reductase
MIARILDVWGRLDIVVCAAGLNIDGPFRAMQPDQWQRVLEVNLNGTFHVCQAAADALVESGNGAIVTFAAQTAFRGRRSGANYCAAKAGVVALTKCVAQELAPAVRANVLIPGTIKTEEVITRLHLDSRRTARPPGRGGRVRSLPGERRGLLRHRSGLVGERWVSDVVISTRGRILTAGR